MAGKRKPKKRKPTRKRRLVRSLPENNIPFSKYRIEWVDIISDSGWATDKEFDRMKLATPVNEGWLYSKDRHHVKVFASYDKEDDGSYTFGDRIMIPWACVKKMYKI
jgi:hypothetical protein